LLYHSKEKRVLAFALGALIPLAAVLMPASIAAADVPTRNERPLSDVATIAAGDYAAYAVKKDGSVWSWGGTRNSGLLGNGYTVASEIPVRMKIDGAKAVAGGSLHALVLKKDGTVWATGSNADGQLGIGDTSVKTKLEPVQVEGLAEIKAIAASGDQSLALQADGTVWQWGKGDWQHPPSFVPKKLELPSALAIAAGSGSAMTLDNGGQVFVLGSGVPERILNRNPILVSGLPETAAIAATRQRAIALQMNGTVWTWNNSKPHVNTLEPSFRPVKVEGAEDARRIAGSSDYSFSLVKSDGTVWTWDGYYDKSSYKAVKVKGVRDAVDVANGRNRHQYALLADGTVMEWTYFLGELSKPKPVQAPIRVLVNGQEVELMQQPVVLNKVLYVPVRGIFEQLGAKLESKRGSGSNFLSKGDTRIEINWTDGFKDNGKPLSDTLKPIARNYVTMVPLQLLAEALGAKVEWATDRNTILITSQEADFRYSFSPSLENTI